MKQPRIKSPGPGARGRRAPTASSPRCQEEKRVDSALILVDAVFLKAIAAAAALGVVSRVRSLPQEP